MPLTETEVLKRQTLLKSKRIGHLRTISSADGVNILKKISSWDHPNKKAVRKNIDYTNQDNILHLVNNISHITLW